MRASPEDLGDFRLADILSFLAVRRDGSVSAAARGLGVTPSQISKSVARLESQLHVTVLTRGGRGVRVSEAGEQVAPYLEDVVACAERVPTAFLRFSASMGRRAFAARR